MKTPSTLMLRREIPVRYATDVLVVGGGPAGVAAALAAARQGVSVRLVDGHSCLGGMGTAGLVPAFMQFSDGVNFLAGGMGRDIFDALCRANGTVPPPKGLSIRAEVLKRVYEELMTAANIPFTYHTSVLDVKMRRGGRVAAAICGTKRGLMAITAKAYVDATGDGDLAAFGGAPFDQGDASGRLMPGTLCSLWAGIDWDAVWAGGLGTGAKRIEEAIAAGVFTLPDRHLPGMWTVGRTVGGGNIGHTFGVDGTDEESLTRAFCWGRKSLLEYEKYYKDYLKGFEQMELVATGSLMGVRATRRIRGDYELNLDDFKRQAVFEDEIGRYSYPVDIHPPTPDKASFENFKKEYTSLRLGHGENYGIPYRILTPQKLVNVWVSGRCVSTDTAMQSSIRVMPGCYITGQAAGVAAATAVVEGALDSRAVSVRSIQARLKALGAFLPNFA